MLHIQRFRALRRNSSAQPTMARARISLWQAYKLLGEPPLVAPKSDVTLRINFSIASRKHCCRSFSAETMDLMNRSDTSTNQVELDPTIPKAKSNLRKVLEVCGGKSWNKDVEEALGEYSGKLSHHLVARVVQNMGSDFAQQFFTWSGKQEGYEHSKHVYIKMFTNLIRSGNFEKALEILKEMKENDMSINPKLFVTLVHYFGKAGMAAKAEEIPEIMESFGFRPNPKVYDAALTGFIKAGDYERAEKWIQRLSDESIESKIDYFNSAVAAYARSNEMKFAEKVMEEMEKNDCPPNIQTYKMLVKSMCKSNKIDEAIKCCEAMHEKGLNPDVDIYNTLISDLCEGKKMDEALQLFQEMKSSGLKPDITTHNCIIKGYLKSGQYDKATQHLGEMEADGCTPTTDTKRLFIVNQCKVNDIEKAMGEFRTASEKGEKLSPDSCNILLHGLIKGGKLAEALGVLDAMKGGVCTPDVSSYVIVLRGCCNLYKLDKAKQLLGELKAERLQLPISTFNMLMQTFSIASKFDDVGEMFDELLVTNPKLLTREATAILDALNRARQLDKGIQLCKYVMDKGNIKVQSRQLQHLLRLLNKKDRKSEATELMNAMVEQDCVIKSDE